MYVVRRTVPTSPDLGERSGVRDQRMSNGTKSLTSAYLILYNLIQSVGWSAVVMSLINAVIKGADVKGMYVAAEGFTRK